jgi:hypothetical protein
MSQDAVEIAKQWYNFHPDTKFDNFFDVVQRAATVINPENFALSTRLLMAKMPELFYIEEKKH